MHDLHSHFTCACVWMNSFCYLIRWTKVNSTFSYFDFVSFWYAISVLCFLISFSMNKGTKKLKQVATKRRVWTFFSRNFNEINWLWCVHRTVNKMKTEIVGQLLNTRALSLLHTEHIKCVNQNWFHYLIWFFFLFSLSLFCVVMSSWFLPISIMVMLVAGPNLDKI